MSKIRNDNYTVILIGLTTFAWSMIFVWQGLDFTDMGVWLTGYQQFYANPDTIHTSCWLSCFIGHWIGLALGGGVLAYRLGYVVVNTMLAMIAYQLLATQFRRGRMLAAMVMLTVFFIRIYSGNWVGYYELTALFYLVGAALLYYGLVGNKKQLLILAGVILGANLFIRFPNLLGIALVSAVWLYAWFYRWSIRNVLVGSACFLGGFAIGVVLVWGLIVLHGHQTIYFQGIQGLFGQAVDAGSNYGSSRLLKRFIWDHFLAIANGLLVVFILGWIAKWVSKIKNILITIIIILSSALLLFYFLYVYNLWQWCVPGICYILLLTIIFLESREKPSMALLAFIAGLLLFLTTIGSGDGLNLSVNGMWLALSLILMWLKGSSDLVVTLNFRVCHNGFESVKSIGKISLSVRGFHVFSTIIVLALLFQSLSSAWQHTFRDSNNRFAMTHSIAHPLLAGIYTTKARANVVDELLKTMSIFIKPGDEVLAYNSITTVHFLTQTHPWLGDPWPDLADPKKISALIQRKEEAGARLPCIVRATGSTWANSWPIQAKPPIWLNLNKLTPHLFEEFVRKHGYVVVWSNDFFEILTTEKSLK